jgi:hypothetical protein
MHASTAFHWPVAYLISTFFSSWPSLSLEGGSYFKSFIKINFELKEPFFDGTKQAIAFVFLHCFFLHRSSTLESDKTMKQHCGYYYIGIITIIFKWMLVLLFVFLCMLGFSIIKKLSSTTPVTPGGDLFIKPISLPPCHTS